MQLPGSIHSWHSGGVHEDQVHFECDAYSVKYDLGSDENNPIIMLQSLQSSNDQIISDLKECFALASLSDEQGAANFIAERIDAHEKWRWKFKASLTSMGVN